MLPLYFGCTCKLDSAVVLQVVEELVSNVTVIEKLQSFQYKDKNGKDWGLNVRQRAKELTNLVLDGERIRAERSKVISILAGGSAQYAIL